MPFKSTAQQRYMYAQHPRIARRWTDEMRGGSKASRSQREHPIKHANLPDHVDKSLGGRLVAGAQRYGAKVGAEARDRNATRVARQAWVDRPGNPTTEETREAQRQFGLVRGSLMSAKRGKPPGTTTVGKRLNAGSFESGPSSLLPGVPRSLERRGRTSSTYGGTSGHGRRMEEVDKALVPADALNSAKQQVQTAAQGAMKKTKPLQNQVKAGFQAGRGGYGGAAQGLGERAGALAGQATATPMRQAGTAATAGALAGMGTMSVLQPQQGLVNPPRTIGGPDPNQGMAKRRIRKALVPDGKDQRKELYSQASGMDKEHRSRHGRAMERTRFHGPRPRHYDPELTRQRRVGQAQAATGLGGAAAAAAGGREIARNSKRIKGGIKVTPRSGGLVGAGLAGIGAAEGIRRYADNPRSRRWT